MFTLPDPETEGISSDRPSRVQFALPRLLCAAQDDKTNVSFLEFPRELCRDSERPHHTWPSAGSHSRLPPAPAQWGRMFGRILGANLFAVWRNNHRRWWRKVRGVRKQWHLGCDFCLKYNRIDVEQGRFIKRKHLKYLKISVINKKKHNSKTKGPARKLRNYVF